MKVSKLKPNPNNPRKIAPDQLDKLKRSIESFPEMMELRPIIYDPETMHVLGGNQRLAAIKALGMKEIPDEWAMPADKLTDEQKREFVIKDNALIGEWDYDLLESDWADLDLGEWGVDLIVTDDMEFPDNLIGSNREKPPSIKILFNSIDDLMAAEGEIAELLEKYPKSIYSVSAGEI